MIYRYTDVMRRSSALSETIDEALQHMQIQLQEGFFENAILLFKDVVSAYYEIERANQPLHTYLSVDTLNMLGDQVTENLNMVVSALEQGERERAPLLIKSLLSLYCDWKQELQNCYHKYIAQ